MSAPNMWDEITRTSLNQRAGLLVENIRKTNALREMILARQAKRPPPTLIEKMRRRIGRFRYWLGAKIAGVEDFEDDEL